MPRASYNFPLQGIEGNDTRLGVSVNKFVGVRSVSGNFRPGPVVDVRKPIYGKFDKFMTHEVLYDTLLYVATEFLNILANILVYWQYGEDTTFFE